VISFVLNTCVNTPHQATVSCVIFRPSRTPSEDQMPVAVTSCVDGNFKLWSLCVDSEVSGLFTLLMVMHVCLTEIDALISRNLFLNLSWISDWVDYARKHWRMLRSFYHSGKTAVYIW